MFLVYNHSKKFKCYFWKKLINYPWARNGTKKPHFPPVGPSVAADSAKKLPDFRLPPTSEVCFVEKKYRPRKNKKEKRKWKPPVTSVSFGPSPAPHDRSYLRGRTPIPCPPPSATHLPPSPRTSSRGLPRGQRPLLPSLSDSYIADAPKP